jgi:hypothetical protein
MGRYGGGASGTGCSKHPDGLESVWSAPGRPAPNTSGVMMRKLIVSYLISLDGYASAGRQVGHHTL